MPRIIGIDLGTTNTSVAVMEGGRPRVIEDERGYKVLPSVISAKGEGKFVVGQAAHNLILTRPERTVYATKRLIGRRFDSPEVQEAIRRVNYKVRPAPDGGVEVMVGDQWMSPTEVAAVVLQVARTIAEKTLGERIEEAVITVPAYFNHAQRKATIEAAEMAGLRCDRLLHEPTAAALAFGHRKNVERTILIFDLGGGTFDVSVLRLSSGIYETLSTRGDSYLGGEDLDSRIVDHMLSTFKDRSGVDLTSDKNAVQRVRDAAERAKCELSFSDRTNIVIPHVTTQHSIEMVLTRTMLEEITADLVSRCIDIARRAVVEGGLKLSEIDEVILVGGQTRMPKIREAITALLGKEPSRTVHPEEAVAVGAAVHAANLADADQSRTVLLDVTPFDLGIDSAGGHFVPVIHRNGRVPATETRTFATANDNQESVRVTVRQGESRVSSENEFLGEFVLTGLSPAPRMQTKVNVTFRIDGNGMLHVSAVEKGSGERKNITIRNYAEHAASPHMPSPEEAQAAEAERARKLVQAAPAGPTAAPRVGLFDGLVGAFLRKPKATPPVVRAPTPSTATAATSSGGRSEASSEGNTHQSGPASPGANPVGSGSEVDAPTPVLAGLDEVFPPIREPGPAIILPDFDPALMVGQDEVFALEGEEVEPFEGTLVEEPVRPAAIGIAGGAHDRLPEPVPEPFATPAAVLRLGTEVAAETQPPASWAGFDREDEDTNGGREGVPRFLEAPSEDAPFALGGGDSEGGFDFRAPHGDGLSEASSVGAASIPGTDAVGFELDPGPPAEAELTFAFAGDEPDTAEPAAKADDLAFLPDPAVEDPNEFLRQAFGDEAEFAFPEDSRSVEPAAGDSAHSLDGTAAESAKTPNGDDTAVMRRGWAWADVDAAAPRAARPVDLGPDPFARPAGEAAPAGRKPARVRLRYPDLSRLGEEYRENLRKGGTFIKTPKPLAVGRECICEVSAPGLEEPLLFPSVVTFVATGGPGQEAGMGIEYRLSDADRRTIERLIDRL